MRPEYMRSKKHRDISIGYRKRRRDRPVMRRMSYGEEVEFSSNDLRLKAAQRRLRFVYPLLDVMKSIDSNSFAVRFITVMLSLLEKPSSQRGFTVADGSWGNSGLAFCRNFCSGVALLENQPADEQGMAAAP